MLSISIFHIPSISMRDIHRSEVTANGIIFGKSKGGFFCEKLC